MCKIMRTPCVSIWDVGKLEKASPVRVLCIVFSGLSADWNYSPQTDYGLHNDYIQRKNTVLYFGQRKKERVYSLTVT